MTSYKYIQGKGFVEVGKPEDTKDIGAWSAVNTESDPDLDSAYVVFLAAASLLAVFATVAAVILL